MEKFLIFFLFWLVMSIQRKKVCHDGLLTSVESWLKVSWLSLVTRQAHSGKWKKMSGRSLLNGTLSKTWRRREKLKWKTLVFNMKWGKMVDWTVDSKNSFSLHCAVVATRSTLVVMLLFNFCIETKVIRLEKQGKTFSVDSHESDQRTKHLWAQNLIASENRCEQTKSKNNWPHQIYVCTYLKFSTKCRMICQIKMFRIYLAVRWWLLVSFFDFASFHRWKFKSFCYVTMLL